MTTDGLPERQSTSVIRVIGRMHSDTFKRRLVFSVIVIKFGLKQLLLSSKSFVIETLQYKAKYKV